MAGTTLIYNSVTISDCETLAFDQSVTYDESGTDPLYSTIRIRVRGGLHLSADHSHNVTPGVTTTSTLVTRAQQATALLSQHGGIFSYWIGDTILLAANSDSSSLLCDANNGPKPRGVTIQPIGSSYLRVEFEIEIARVLCADAAGARGTLSPVLNNRWSVSEERDSNFFGQRTIEGLLRVANVSHWPQTFRGLVVPALPDGYQRVRMRFADSADGLSLRYTIVDRQRYAAPPAPATDWHATYTESTSNQGALQFGEMRVMLQGEPGVDKQRLATVAHAVVAERLRGIINTEAGDSSHALIMHTSLTEHLHEPRIDLSVTCKHSEPSADMLGARFRYIGRDNFETQALDGYNPDKWPAHSAYSGSVQAQLWAHYLQNPCDAVHAITPSVTSPEPGHEDQEDDQSQDRQDQGQAPETVFQQQPDDLQQLPPRPIDPLQTTSTLYTHWELESDYVIDQGTVHLPVSAHYLNDPTSIHSVAAHVCRPLAQRVVFIHAERANAWPEFPLPNSYTDGNGIGYTLLAYKIHPRGTILLPDGRQKLYRAMMEYRYGMSRAPEGGDGLYVGHDPRLLSSAEAEVFSVGNVLTGAFE